MSVFHHTRIENLTESSPTAPNSMGHPSARLVFATHTHLGSAGANYYSHAGDYGVWTYQPSSTGWVGLELAVNAGTKLKRGYIGRSCINRAPL